MAWSGATWNLGLNTARQERRGGVFYFDRVPTRAEQSDFDSDTEWDQLSDYGSHDDFIEEGLVFEPSSESASASTPGTNRADSKICLLAAEDLVQLAQASKRSWRLAARVAFIAGRVVRHPIPRRDYPIESGWLQLSQASNMALKAAAVIAREYMKSWKATSFLQTC